MLNLGKVQPGSTIYIPFDTFAGSTGAPITITGLATSDIQIYKDGGTTQRASASGITLLDTDGIDFDAITGIHGFSIDLADNTTADFYASGSKYFVVVSTITVDSQTMSFLAATFTIGEAGSILDTTIATLSSQTSFTLTAGPADNSALVGCVAVVHDTASAIQQCFGYVSAYTGSTKTVTLIADPGVFTMAAKDNISFMPPQKVDLFQIRGTTQTARDIGASVLLSSGTGTGQLDFTSGVVKANLAQILGTALTETAGQIAAAFKQFFDVASPTGTMKAITNVVTTTNVTTVNGLAADVITAASMAADAGAEIADAVWDEAIAGHLGAGSTGLALNSAGAAGDPWSTAIPGAYGAGTAGHRLGNIPDVAAGAAGGVFIAGTNAATTITTGLTTTFTGNLTGSVNSVTADVGITQAGADKVWSTTTRALTDKANFTLSAAGVQAIWDALTSALTTAGSIGKLLVDNINATIASRMATYTQPTGFLSATFPSGTIANTTNITAGTITTATNVTTVNDKTGYRLSATGVDDILDETATTVTGKPNTLRSLIWFMRKIWSNKRTYDKATNHQIIYEDDGTTAMLDATMVNDASEATRGAA